MSLSQTPLSERINIVLCGLRNAGKSSLLNNLVGQNIAIISDEPGTTTDPVTKAMEIGKLGPVSITDTAGIDDDSVLGGQRVAKSDEKIKTGHIILLVTHNDTPLSSDEIQLIEDCKKNNKTLIAVLTHSDKPADKSKQDALHNCDIECVNVDNLTSQGIEALKNKLESLSDKIIREITPLDGIVNAGQLLYLITPVDSAAPKGRLILPQVETLRDALDRGCGTMVVQADRLSDYYKRTDKPDLIITDSQAFAEVAAAVPPEQNLTSFSILFARKKGDMDYYIEGLQRLKNVPPNAKILIWESCTHHKKEDDIGTVKIPNLFRKKIRADVTFDFAHGLDRDIASLKDYHLIITCGACMITRSVMMAQINVLREHEIPITNYGLFLAYTNGLLPRALECLPEAFQKFNKIIT